MAIAGVDGLDKLLQKKVISVLAEHGIYASMEGSVVYAIYVNRKDTAAALQTLKEDKRLVGEKIVLYEPPFRVNCPPRTIEKGEIFAT